MKIISPAFCLLAFGVVQLYGYSSQPSVISPGIGLEGKDGTEVVIFEHTSMGTGGLVLNRPTPVLLRDLAMPRFSGVFGSNSLMLGYGVSLLDDDNREGPGDNIKIGDMAPWFWLHDVDGISGSFRLEGASHSLYMGGNMEEAIHKVKAENIDPLEHFKFFWKYRAWKSGELDEEIKSGKWSNVKAQDPKRALKAYSIGLPRLRDE